MRDVGRKLGNIVISLCFASILFLIPFPWSEVAYSSDAAVKIGCTAPLQTRSGLQTKKWMELFCKLTNESGGLKVNAKSYQLDLVFYDDAYNAEKARSAAERLVNSDKVKYIINQWAGVATLATIKVSEPNKVLVIGDGMTNEPCKPEYHYCYKGFGTFFLQGWRGIIAAEMKQKGLNTVVTVQPDDEIGHVSAEQIKKSYAVLGIDILDTLFFRRGTTDFSPIATKIKNLNPKFVDTSSTVGTPVTLLICALHDVGFRGKLSISGMDQPICDDIITRIGPEYLEGALSILKDAKLFAKDPAILELISAYEKEYGQWESEGCYWVGSWFLFTDAIRKTQSLDVDVLANYLSSSPAPVMTFSGLSQQFARPDLQNFRTIDNATELWSGITSNGRITPYKRVTVKDQYLYSIKFYGLDEVYKNYWQKYGYPKFAGE
jgi:ABC-type branched-subunit amino acid transport system substrate-binding protein